MLGVEVWWCDENDGVCFDLVEGLSQSSKARRLWQHGHVHCISKVVFANIHKCECLVVISLSHQVNRPLAAPTHTDKYQLLGDSGIPSSFELSAHQESEGRSGEQAFIL
jgi:hypothetical protein